jgi:hypothetical protein
MRGGRPVRAVPALGRMDNSEKLVEIVCFKIRENIFNYLFMNDIF